ncbi:acetate--CoA ligase family protein [Geobacter sp.]|uniref:acetate--CoA ligase family protein n=1 Tax=Geobacter sp. TaxID=46610 RepID=UPI00262D93C7|nr:acetate--CoA ligase family protein [Geobacter sp.]
MSSLDALFDPRSVALVGASAEGSKLSCIVLKNLLHFKGSVYPVNPACPQLMGIPSCRSIRDIPEPVDLSIIMRPAHEVPEILRTHRGMARCVIVVSAGFAEIGALDLQREIAAIGKELGIRILGPNCLGVFNPSKGLDTLFLPRERLERPERGKTAVVSQSGAILITLLEALAEKGTGASRAANYGNAVDIDAPDIYDYLADDKATDVVVAKVASGRIAAKSDVGGVQTGIRNRDELERTVAQLGEISGAEGVLLEEEAPPGLEVIVGGTVDPQFGPVVMFGLGGLFVELFRDVAFALAPTTRKEALRLVERTKGSRLLSGFRGRPPVDRQALAGVIVTVSELIASGLVAEVDLNPVVLYPSGALVVDAKMARAKVGALSIEVVDAAT